MRTKWADHRENNEINFERGKDSSEKVHCHHTHRLFRRTFLLVRETLLKSEGGKMRNEWISDIKRRWNLLSHDPPSACFDNITRCFKNTFLRGRNTWKIRWKKRIKLWKKNVKRETSIRNYWDISVPHVVFYAKKVMKEEVSTPLIFFLKFSLEKLNYNINFKIIFKSSFESFLMVSFNVL